MPNTPPSTDAEIEMYLRQIADEQIAKSGPPSTSTAPPEPQPIKMNIGGQEMTFKDQGEVASYMNNRIGQYEQQVSQFQNTGKGRQVTSDESESPQFDQKHWIDLVGKDAIAAQEYMDEFRFGVKNPSQLIKNNFQLSQQIAQENAARSFVDNHPDYTPTPENAQTLHNTLNQYNLPFNAQGLEAAYALAVRGGHIKEARKEEPASQPGPEETNPYLYGPPVSSRNNSASAQQNDGEFDAWNLEYMPLKDLEKLVQRMSNR